jgi:ubiquinone/menaquinone biosynthesis C-methylase UbiE/ketosteroid isomerase-like protein
MAIQNPQQVETFQKAFPRLNSGSIAAFNRGDVATCAGFYAEEATLLLPDRPVIKGRKNIEAYLKEFADSGIKLTPVEPVEIVSNGDIGCCAGTYLYQSSSESSVAGTWAGKFVTIFRQQPDGSWKAVIDSFFGDAVPEPTPHIPTLADTRLGVSSTLESDYATRQDARETYQKGARFYDSFVWLYYAAGMRIGLWRRKVIEALALRPGDTVVEIGCGTGLNFALLQEAVGSSGRIIGVDISEAMLERAEARVRDAGWNNVELFCCSAVDYQFPRGVGGIFATGVLNYEPAYDQVIARGAQALAPSRRWVVLDYKMPKNWLRYLAPAFIFLGSAFGVSRNLMESHPWESVQRHLRNTQMQELYGGFVYIISGKAS